MPDKLISHSGTKPKVSKDRYLEERLCFYHATSYNFPPIDSERFSTGLYFTLQQGKRKVTKGLELHKT